MRLIDGDQMAVDETEAYMAAQEQIKDLDLLRANVLVHAKLQKLIADTPTVDAVPVVRCGECRYYRASSSIACVCCHPGGMKFTSDSDYCSRGERCSNQSAQVRNMVHSLQPEGEKNEQK